MIEKSDKTTTASGRGQKFDTPIPFEWTWKEYENFAELDKAGDKLSEEEQVKVRNTQRANNARSKALTAALDAAGIEKQTAENNDQIRLRDMFKVLMTSKKYTEEAAWELAENTLGIKREAE